MTGMGFPALRSRAINVEDDVVRLNVAVNVVQIRMDVINGLCKENIMSIADSAWPEKHAAQVSSTSSAM